MLSQHLNALIGQTSLTVTIKQQKQLLKLVELLDKWNKAYNLTSVRNPDDMLVRHIMDSIIIGQYLKGKRFIDVGTGPGLPGLPLAICNPDKEFVLLDSLGKRIRFIRQVIYTLDLTNVTAVESRVETYRDQECFDGVISRAFASMKDMVEWCHHLPKDNEGMFYALKGQLNPVELDEIPAAYSVIEKIILSVPELKEQRHLVLLQAQEPS